MFETVINAVRTGDQTRIKQFIHEELKDVFLTEEEIRELITEAVITSNYELIQVLLKRKLPQNKHYLTGSMKLLNGRTMLGYAVLEKFDERLITLLASEGCCILSKEECNEFVSILVENYNSGDLTKFDTYLSRLKFILSHCLNTDFQKSMRNCLYSDPRNREVISTVEWLKNHFTYGYGLVSFYKVNKVYMEMGEGRWSDAVSTIRTLHADDIDKTFYETFPPGDDIPSWTLLSYAVSKRNTDVIKLLISKGAYVNEHSERIYRRRLVKFTPFELAVEMNFLECCQILVDNGANLYFQSTNPIGNILENAIRHENIALVELILTHRKYSDQEVQTCLSELVGKISDKNIQAKMKELLEIYKLFGQTEVTSTIQAMLLIYNGQDEEAIGFIRRLSLDKLEAEIFPVFIRISGVIMNVLEAQRLDYDWKPGFTSILTCATKFNKLEIVQNLLEMGCDVNKPRTEVLPGNLVCKHALLLATEENNYDMCKMLLKYGAHVKRGDTRRYFIFRNVFNKKNSKIFKLLIHHSDHPCTVFQDFLQYADSVSISGEDVMSLFSVEVISCFLHRSRVSSQMWRDFVHGDPIRDFIERNLKNRFYIINLILQYLPSAPPEVNGLLCSLTKNPNEVQGISKETELLLRSAVKCPSLQNLCRFALRETVQPFTESNIQTLGLPVQIQEYLLEHPLERVLSHFQNEAVRCLPVAMQVERFYK